MKKKENKIKTQSVTYNFIMNAILKMSSFIFPMITFPYVSRVLGAIGNGKISFATAFVSYFSMIATLGIPTYGIRVCAQCRDNKQELSKTVQELLMIETVMTILAYITMVIITVSVPKLEDYTVLIFVTSLSLVLTSFGMEWFYQAIEEYGYITYRNLAFKILSIALMFLFVKNKSDYIVYAAINVLGTVGSNILNLCRIRRYIFIKPQKNYNIRRHIKPIMVFFMLSVATKIYTSLDTVMLGFMSNDAEVGYYSAATKMKNILVSLVTALGTVLLPRVSYYVENEMTKKFAEVIKQSIQFVMVMAIPITCFFMVEASDTILFLAGKEYNGAIASMIMITPTIFLIGISNIIGIQVLVPLGYEQYTVNSTIVGAVVDLILNAIFIPMYGSLGAALGTLVAEFAVVVVQVIYVFKLKMRDYVGVDWLDIGKTVGATVIAFIAVIFVRHSIAGNSYFINLVITAVVFYGVYAALLVLLKEEIINRHLVKKIIKKKK